MNGLSGLFSALPPALVGIVAITLAIIQLIVTILLAVAVKNDAQRRQQSQEGVFLVSPWMWFFIVALTGGYPGSLGYWLIHYSAQRYRP
jgi:hypothetical protein